MKFPEKYRIRHGESGSRTGENGAFIIPCKGTRDMIFCIASRAYDWEHVSVTIRQVKRGAKPRVPTWDEMCRIKDLFFDRSECVIQYHPPESEYVNCHNFCLHLWRPMTKIIPMPPKILV